MRGFAFVSVFGAGFLCLAQPVYSFAQPADAKAPADQADTLRVAPNAPRSTPEVQSEAAHGFGNICQELVAFIQKANADSSKPEAAKDPAAQPSSAPSAGAPNNASSDTSQRQSGVSAPVPKGDASTAPAQLSLEQARSLEGARDLRGCQRAAQQMRRAGVALPPGLLALAALREDLLR